jgi:hypothetical protein
MEKPSLPALSQVPSLAHVPLGEVLPQPAKVVRIELQRDPAHAGLTARVRGARWFLWHEYILPAGRT